MPLVQANGLFYSLQSIAIDKGRPSGVITVGSSLGGASAAMKVKEFCNLVDNTEVDSVQRKLVQTAIGMVESKHNVKKLNGKIDEAVRSLENVIEKVAEQVIQ